MSGEIAPPLTIPLAHLIMPPQAPIHLDVACQLLVGSVAQYVRTGLGEMTTLPS